MPMSAIVPIGTVTVGMPRWRIAKLPLATHTPLRQPRVGRRRVHVHVGGPDVGDRGEDHRVEAKPVHPLLEVDLPGALQAAQPVGEVRDVEERVDRVVAHERRDTRRCRRRTRRSGRAGRQRGAGRFGCRRRPRAGSARGRRWRRGSRPTPTPTGRRSRVAGTRADEPAGRDRRRARAVALVVADDGEVDVDHLGARGLAGRARTASNRSTTDCACLDALAGRPADARRADARVRIGVDVHPRHAEPLAGERSAPVASAGYDGGRTLADARASGTHGCARQKSPRVSGRRRPRRRAPRAGRPSSGCAARRRPSSAPAASRLASRSRRATACTRIARCWTRVRGPMTRSPRRCRTRRATPPSPCPSRSTSPIRTVR